MFICCSIYIETAQNSPEECNEFADLLFFRLCATLIAAHVGYVYPPINFVTLAHMDVES